MYVSRSAKSSESVIQGDNHERRDITRLMKKRLSHHVIFEQPTLNVNAEPLKTVDRRIVIRHCSIKLLIAALPFRSVFANSYLLWIIAIAI